MLYKFTWDQPYTTPELQKELLDKKLSTLIKRYGPVESIQHTTISDFLPGPIKWTDTPYISRPDQSDLYIQVENLDVYVGCWITFKSGLKKYMYFNKWYKGFAYKIYPDYNTVEQIKEVLLSWVGEYYMKHCIDRRTED